MRWEGLTARVVIVSPGWPIESTVMLVPGRVVELQPEGTSSALLVLDNNRAKIRYDFIKGLVQWQ
jgi:hypothetical protein